MTWISPREENRQNKCRRLGQVLPPTSRDHWEALLASQRFGCRTDVIVSTALGCQEHPLGRCVCGAYESSQPFPSLLSRKATQQHALAVGLQVTFSRQTPRSPEPKAPANARSRHLRSRKEGRSQGLTAGLCRSDFLVTPDALGSALAWLRTCPFDKLDLVASVPSCSDHSR